MKKLIIVIGLQFVLVGMVHAEESVEHTNVLKVKYGWNYQLDSYLSPLAYRGMELGIGNEWWQPFRQKDSLSDDQLSPWAHVGRLDIRGVKQINSARSNIIYGLGISGGWGAYYHWRWYDERLKVLIGPYLEAEFCARELRSNVNKPYSFDISAEVMVMGGLSWSFYGKKTSYRLHYTIRTNVIGFDYLPDYWQSYYELSQGVEGTPRCSGHWNHHTIKHEIGLNLQFPHSTWRVGGEHEYVKYGTKDLHFIRNEISIVLGCIWNYRIQGNKRL